MCRRSHARVTRGDRCRVAVFAVAVQTLIFIDTLMDVVAEFVEIAVIHAYVVGSVSWSNFWEYRTTLGNLEPCCNISSAVSDNYSYKYQHKVYQA